jgi:biotin carboxylase
MAKERLLILGAGVMQGPVITLAREMGLEAVVVDADASAPCAFLADRFEAIDLKDKEGVEAFARSLMHSGGLSGIMTAGTDFSATVAWAAEKLGLPGISYEAALDASDKARMRNRFKEAGVPSPEFLVLAAEPPPDFSLPFGCPAVVKPVDNMGGRGCRRVDKPEDLAGAVREALGFSRSRRAIVEAYMEGPEYSVDALVYGGTVRICGFADRHIRFPPYFIEMGHTMPSSLDRKNTGALLDVFIRGIRALGITRGAAKGDLKLTPRGPMIGEIAARLSGGYMSGWTYPYASGVEPIRGAIRIALGQAPGDLEPSRNWTSAERAIISIPGKIRAIRGLEEARKAALVRDVFLRAGPGSRVSFPENNVSKCGNVITAGADREAAVLKAEDAVRLILLRLEAPDGATEDFLARPPGPAGAFPPDAFTLPETLYPLLAAFPEPENRDHAGEFVILPFPELLALESRDYAGRTPADSLRALRILTGLPLPLERPCAGASRVLLGRSFWTALVRGGYQGAAYVVDRLKNRENSGGDRR